MDRSRLWHWGGLLVLLSLLLGCSLFSVTPPATVSLPTATSSPTATAAPSETPAVTSPGDICPEPSAVSPPQREDAGGEAQDVEAWIDEVRTYLSAGGDPADVPLLDYEALHRGDLTGEGSQETIYAFIDLQAQQLVPAVHLVVFACRAQEMTVLYHYVPMDGYSLELIGVEDLTQDGVADLVFSEFTCGAHTCWHTPLVWSWGMNDFENRMAEEFQYPFPTYELRDNELVVMSVGVGSVGAGPQRPSTTTLAWTGEAIAVIEETLDEPTYRYHAFLDGERALSTGAYDEAESAYARVIEDASLEPWGAFYGAEEERAWLEILAQWRKVILAVMTERPVEAQAAYEALDVALGEQDPGVPVLVLAQRFWQAYQEGSDAAAACAFAINALESEAVLDFLNSFGYANPIYEHSDLCPVLDFVGE